MRMFMSKRWMGLTVWLMCFFFLSGCASFVRNSYISMDSTAITYSASMIGTKGAYTTGKITSTQWERVVNGGKIFHKSFDLAITGLLDYKNTPATSTQTAVTDAIVQLLGNWVDLSSLINQILPGTVPVASMNSVTLKGKTLAGQKFTITVKKLDSGEISIIIQIGAAVVQYLIPAIQSLIMDIGKVSISDADIIALKDLVKDPDQY
jgi:uncharacterized protein YceK